jgi:hypothetical protein
MAGNRGRNDHPLHLWGQTESTPANLNTVEGRLAALEYQWRRCIREDGEIDWRFASFIIGNDPFADDGK